MRRIGDVENRHLRLKLKSLGEAERARQRRVVIYIVRTAQAVAPDVPEGERRGIREDARIEIKLSGSESAQNSRRSRLVGTVRAALRGRVRVAERAGNIDRRSRTGDKRAAQSKAAQKSLPAKAVLVKHFSAVAER